MTALETFKELVGVRARFVEPATDVWADDVGPEQRGGAAGDQRSG